MMREKLKKQEKENRFLGSIILKPLHFNYNAVQERDNGLVLRNSSQELQIIRNCVAFCAFNGALQGSLLQKQAKNLIEGKRVDSQYDLYRILVEVKK